MLTRLAHHTIRFRWLVIAVWIVLAAVGVVAAGRMSNRWNQSMADPGRPAYQASQRALAAFGAGVRPPTVIVFHAAGDVTMSHAIEQAMRRATDAVPGALVSSYYTTHDLAYVSHDRRTTFMEIYPPGPSTISTQTQASALRTTVVDGLPAGVSADVTGQEPLQAASTHGSAGGSSVLVEALIAGAGALVVLVFVFGTLPAVLAPLLVAAASILNSFTLVWAFTHVTAVSIVVQFLIALVGLGVAIDYSLLMVYRFRDELHASGDTRSAVVSTVEHAGRSVIVSGGTVAAGLLSMAAIPVPLVRSIGVAGMVIPAVSVLASITLLPALLCVCGTRINSVPVLPHRWRERNDGSGAWVRWARYVIRRPRRVAVAGILLVGVLAGFGIRLNASEPQLANIPGIGTAINGRQTLTASGITPGVMKPLDVLVENGTDPQRVARALNQVPGITAAVAPGAWRHGPDSLVEAFPTTDGAAPGIGTTISRMGHVLAGMHATVTGAAAVDQEYRKTLFANVPYVLGLVLGLTLLLLTRAFRSIVLAVKAVALNLLSLAAAYGIVVIIFQQGHGSSLWHMTATHSVTPWLPLMMFAFLFGLSMDYEVFMLMRIREAYDQTGSTDTAIEHGLARTGKLVTSAAVILTFAFLLLAASPGYLSKEFGISLGGAILIDATVIRAMLVPALIRLLGRHNWWFPRWARKTPSLPSAVLAYRSALIPAEQKIASELNSTRSA
jgi:RND superfamily putative drug exporter